MFGLGRKTEQTPLVLASSPGYVAAVQLTSRRYRERPSLRLAQVSANTAKAGDRLDLGMRQSRLRHAVVRVLLESSEYQFLQTEFPMVPAEELKTAIRWQVKDMLRLPMDKVTLDVAPPLEQTHGMRRPQGYVVAAANDLILERMQQFRAYNSTVDVIDVPEMAQRNLADLLEVPGRGTLVLSITHNGCLLTASRDGALYFSRSFDLSLASLASQDAMRRDQFDRLVLELQRSVDVVEHQFSSLSASCLWLAPFGYADELLSLLIENLYIPVKPIVLETLFDCSLCPLPAHADHQATIFHALGLALRDVERES